MCRYPVLSAASTAAAVSSGGDWKTPSPIAGMATPLLRTRSSIAALTITSVASTCDDPAFQRRSDQGPAHPSLRVVWSRCTAASASCSVEGALQLDDAEHDHPFDLAQAAHASPAAPAG